MCRPYRWRLSIPEALIPLPIIPTGIWDPVGTCVCPSPTVPFPLAWAVYWRSQGSSFPWRPCPSLCASVHSWAVRSSISPRGPSPHSARPLASSVSSRALALPLLMPRPPLSSPLFSSFVSPLALSHWGHPSPESFSHCPPPAPIAGLPGRYTRCAISRLRWWWRGGWGRSGALQSTRNCRDPSWILPPHWVPGKHFFLVLFYLLLDFYFLSQTHHSGNFKHLWRTNKPIFSWLSFNLLHCLNVLFW